VEIESMADNKLVDVVAEKPGEECIAIEIELCRESNPDHVIENLQRCLAANRITRILCLVTTRDEEKRVNKLVTESGLNGESLQIDRLWKYLEK
jgi:hypothetical protein